MEEVYINIKKRRLELGMTQSELAKAAGYENRSSIARIERGDTNLPQSKMVDIAKALKVTPSYLMGWEDEEVATLTARQEQAVENYFNLTESNQIVVDGLIESLLKQQKG
jgi:transcriptional regulator with XRE-family HTH domain